MSFTVFLGNLPTWVTADDIKGWLTAENLVADAIKVIRNPETQESKGFAFIEAPNTEEMNSIIRRFDRAPLEDRLLRANPAQPARPKGQGRPPGGPGPGPAHGAPTGHSTGHNAGQNAVPGAGHTSAPGTGHQGSEHRPPPPRRTKKTFAKRSSDTRGPQSSFAEELAKAL
jgi:RNA recognition motif-containing protein